MARRTIEVRIVPLRHSLPNAGDAAVSHSISPIYPAGVVWTRRRKSSPGVRAAGSGSAPRGAAPHQGGGATCRGAAEPVPPAAPEPSAHASHRRLATCSEGRSWRGRLRLGPNFTRFPLADPRQISGSPHCIERGSRPRGFLGSRGPTATPELGQCLGLWGPPAGSPAPRGRRWGVGQRPRSHGRTPGVPLRQRA